MSDIVLFQKASSDEYSSTFWQYLVYPNVSFRDEQSGTDLGPDGAGTKIFFSPEPGRNFFSHRDRDQK